MSDDRKSCCAAWYESDLARSLLGEAFHPGGLELTARLADRLELGPSRRLLDVAAGRGASALFLAERSGCEVLGLDYGAGNVAAANAAAAQRGLSERVRFQLADAEQLPIADASVDAVLCECAFCTFPEKAAAAAEFARVLRPGGGVGLSDVTRAAAPATADWDSLPAWAACLGGAMAASGYVDALTAAGFEVECVETHDEALRAMARAIRGRLFAAELLIGLKKLQLEGADLAAARVLAQRAEAAVERGDFGYVLLWARKR
ncbi:MAG: class I SAM-dependent methyltransferase [Terriglobales bacterium]